MGPQLYYIYIAMKRRVRN